MNAEEIMQQFQEKGYEVRLSQRPCGVKNRAIRKGVWVTVGREQLRDAVSFMQEMAEEYPHFSIISTADLGDDVELNYHFTLGYGKWLEECAVTFKVIIPKTDLSVPSLTDIVPAIIFSEREITEMMGVEVEGLPDKRHLFLTPDFPEGVYPWRRDETGPTETNKLYERWKP